MDEAAVRQIAIALPEVTEAPHFHFTSFRIDGKIFATMPPGGELLHVFVPEEERELAVAAYPTICAALHWGMRVVGVRVNLGAASNELVENLLRAAYDSKAASPRGGAGGG
jgi:hypothetical protein